MKKNLKIGICTLVLAIPLCASAITVPNVNSIKSITNTVTKSTTNTAKTTNNTANIRGVISQINERLKTADLSVQDSFNSLVSALSSKEEAVKYKAQLSAINANKALSEVEKSAKIAQIMTDYGSVLDETKSALAEKLKSASDTKKNEIINAVVSFAQGSYQYLDIAGDCTSTALSATTNANTAVAIAQDIKSLKDTASVLKNSATSVKNVATQAVAVAKAGGINIKLPKASTSKAKKVNLTL